MNKKQKKILIDAVFVLSILFFAAAPIFNGKNGINLFSEMFSKKLVDAVEKD